MKERPILFSAPMVRAILEGRKTMTRRIVKPQPEIRDYGCWYPPVPVNERWRSAKHYANEAHMRRGLPMDFNPYGQPGDRLWVRERGWIAKSKTAFAPYVGNEGHAPRSPFGEPYKSCPSIHMPRWASRITLEITGVRVERLQEISEADAESEGVAEYAKSSCSRDPDDALDPISYFELLWSAINGRASWDNNPFVWVVEFKRILCER